MTPLILLAAMVAASPVQFAGFVNPTHVSVYETPIEMDTIYGVDRSVRLKKKKLKPDTIGYWLNRRSETYVADSVQFFDQGKVAFFGTREITDTVWVIRKGR